MLTVVLLTFLALPVCAQRRGFVSHSSGSAPVHSSGSPSIRSAPVRTFVPHSSVVVISSGSSFRGSAPFRSGVRFGSSFSFGHNPRFNVFFGSRAFHRPHRFVYPYSYGYSYVYPYVVYPMYPLSYYDAYDYVEPPAQPSYAYDYATGEGNYPAEVGLNEQMRQQRVGIYAHPKAATPESAMQPATTPAAPNREMPATVLIYRDGRSSEVHNYAIVGQTLWTFNERVATKIPLSSLDVDATRKANAERGMDFVVPQ